MTSNLSYESRLHWIMFLRPVLFLLFPIVLACIGVYIYQLFLIFGFISLACFAIELFRYHFTLLKITTKSVIIQSGFLVQQTLEIPLPRIESVDIKQSLFGTIFHYGDILITGSGGTQQRVVGIKDPLTCRRYLEQLMHYQ